jgi:hypothetical protein
VPGTSTEQQAQEITSGLPGYYVATGPDPYTGNDSVVHYWNSGITDYIYSWNAVRVGEGVVQQIDLFCAVNCLTLETVVDKYGAPEKVSTIRYGAESPDFFIGLLYPNQGLEFWTRPAPTQQPRRDAPVVHQIYYAPTSWEEYLDKRGPYCDGCGDWTGFGS